MQLRRRGEVLTNLTYGCGAIRYCLAEDGTSNNLGSFANQ